MKKLFIFSFLIVCWDIFFVFFQKHLNISSSSWMGIRNIPSAIVLFYYWDCLSFPKHEIISNCQKKIWNIQIFLGIFFLTISFYYLGFFLRKYTWEFLLNLLLVSPICEEIVYRRILCTTIVLHNEKKLWAICVSVIAFSILHLADGNLMWYHILGGFLLSGIFLTSQSLLLAIIWHSIGNMICLLFFS